MLVDSKLQQEEKEANLFAMALLMPESHIKRELKRLNVLDSNDFDYESDEKIKLLSEKFQVSEQLILLRLNQLGFFKN